MKFAVSVALVVLLLGMPLGCILASCQAPAAHPCCPRTSVKVICPYDLFDSAKTSNYVVVAAVAGPASISIAAPNPLIAEDLPVLMAADGSDLYIFHRILRV